MAKKILVTGTAGFIGYHLAMKLLERGDEVVGLDSVNDYYDLRVKHGRLEQTGIDHNKAEYNNIIQSDKFKNYRFVKLNLEDKENIDRLFKNAHLRRCVHHSSLRRTSTYASFLMMYAPRI